MLTRRQVWIRTRSVATTVARGRSVSLGNQVHGLPVSPINPSEPFSNPFQGLGLLLEAVFQQPTGVEVKPTSPLQGKCRIRENIRFVPSPPQHKIHSKLRSPISSRAEKSKTVTFGNELRVRFIPQWQELAKHEKHSLWWSHSELNEIMLDLMRKDGEDIDETEAAAIRRGDEEDDDFDDEDWEFEGEDIGDITRISAGVD